MLLMSFTLVAGAVDNALSTYTVGTLQATDAVSTTFYDLNTAEELGTKDVFFVPVNVDVLTFNGPATGFTAGLFYVEFDSSKLAYEPGYFDMDAGVQGYKSSGILGYKNALTKQAFAWSIGYDASVPNKVNFGFASEFMLSGKSISSTNTLIYLPFTAVEGATGTAEVKLTAVDVSDSSNTSYGTDTAYATAVAGGVVISSEPEPDPEPVATTVKTFAKRLYLDNTLYTVGVISEGTDYATETIKAGIRIDKAGVMVPYWTNNAPVSDGKGTSYYAVALNGVTAETDIKAESVSKAVITVNGGAEISGDEVSANDTSVE